MDGAIEEMAFGTVLLYREVAYLALNTIKLPATSPKNEIVSLRELTNSYFAICSPGECSDFLVPNIFSHISRKHQLLFLTIA